MADDLIRIQAALAERYTVHRELGSGGMATVYLAHDLRQDRAVALKVLRPELAQALGPERFLNEVKVTANLQHPNILPLYDSGQTDGLLYYVMPFVEGESLRQRLDREKQLPVEEAVTITRAAAAALAYAHSRGVIHRDIKPENILLTAGQAMVADFGIALAINAAGGNRLTETGLTLGTPHYMSPEQAAGERELSARSDIYSLGVVLYEMLAGRPPHDAATAQGLLAGIVTVDPEPVTTHRRTVPAPVDAALQKALAKTPADRFVTAAAFAEALAGASMLPHETRPPASRPAQATWWRRWALTGWSLAGVLIVVMLWSWLQPRRGPLHPVVRSDLALGDLAGETPQGWAPGIALSPDGSLLVYLASTGDETGLAVRRLDRFETRTLPGTADASSLFFSPDGRWIGFTQQGSLRKIALDGGAPITIASGIGQAYGASWGANDTIVFGHSGGGLFRVGTQAGSTPEPAVSGDLYSPDLLPDADHALVRTRWTQDAEIEVVSLMTGKVTPLGLRGLTPRYVAPGFILYRVGDDLAAVPFDLSSLEVRGSPVTVASNSRGPFAATDFGTLVYLRRSEAGGRSTAVWVSRRGEAETIDADWSGQLTGLALSPDGARLAVTVAQHDEEQVWIKDLPNGALSRFTSEGTINFRPAWMPGGRALTFVSNRSDERTLWTRVADGSRPAELLLAHDVSLWEAAWSRGGTWLLFRMDGAGVFEDLAVIRPGIDSTPRTLTSTALNQEWNVTFSPDDRWIAYTSDESGRREVYVRPFPAWEGRLHVSTDGGTEPIWSHGGSEIFYRDGTGRMVAATVRTQPALAVTGRRVLFDASPYLDGRFSHAYDVTPDDRRFVMIRTDGSGDRLDAILVQNFIDELIARTQESATSPRPARR